MKVTLRIGGHRVKVTAENRNIVVDGAPIHLLAPVLSREGTLFLPLEMVGEILAPLAELPVRWDREERLLHFGAPAGRLLGVEIADGGDGMEIVVRTSGHPRFRDEVDDGGDLLVHFGGALLETDLFPPIPEGGVLSGWEWEVRSDTVTLRLIPTGGVKERRVVSRLRPEGVVIRLSALTTEVSADEVSGAVKVLTRPRRGQGRGVALIVIDAGHGGDDTGCVTPGGLVEKDVVLDIAFRLRNALEEGGRVRVLLTREEDENPALRRRVEMANEAGGDLFLSLHLNGSPVSSLRGTETYILSKGKAGRERIARSIEEATSVYADEPLGGVLGGGIRFVPWDAVQETHRERSARAARRVSDAVGGVEGFETRGIREGPIAVLRGADMPALLVELGFATDGGTESLLSREDVRDRLAARLASALAASVGGGR